MRLVVEQGVWAGRELWLTQSSVVIGRGGESSAAHIVLPEPNASRQHLRLESGPRGWLVVDLGSTNGTFLNGQRLRPHEPQLLREGDRLALGGAVLAVYDVAVEPAESAAPDLVYDEVEEAPPRQIHPALLVAGAAAVILVLAGIVLVLVLVLQPKEEAMPTATPGNLQEQIMTVVPTEFQDMATAIVPLIPTELPLPLFGPTATPEARAPRSGVAHGVNSGP